MSNIDEVIGGAEALGESAGADELLEATGETDPTQPPLEPEPAPEPDVEWAPLLEVALASWNTVAETRWPAWVFTENERAVLSQAWAPVAAKYADGLTMSVEAAAIIATIPVLIPRFMSPAPAPALAGAMDDFPPPDPDPSSYKDPDKRTSDEPGPADL